APPRSNQAASRRTAPAQTDRPADCLVERRNGEPSDAIRRVEWCGLFSSIGDDPNGLTLQAARPKTSPSPNLESPNERRRKSYPSRLFAAGAELRAWRRLLDVGRKGREISRLHCRHFSQRI